MQYKLFKMHLILQKYLTIRDQDGPYHKICFIAFLLVPINEIGTTKDSKSEIKKLLLFLFFHFRTLFVAQYYVVLNCIFTTPFITYKTSGSI